MTDYNAIHKGEQAERLLSYPLFQEAFNTLETALVDALLSLPIEADDQRIRVVAMHKAAQQVRQILGNYVAGASIERAQILEEERKASLLERIQKRIRNV